MSTWSFYRTDDGMLVGGRYSGPEEWLAANTPPGCEPILGDADPLSQRVDLATLQLVDWQPSRPLDTALATWGWDEVSRRWVATPTLAARQADAQAAIDQAAGAARLRYITDVPGQQAVYLRKLEQAHAWLAEPVGDPPPYIAAEAAATGETPTAAAEAILAIATAWDEQLSPAIEGARISGKRAVSAATTAAEVEAALAAAISTLDNI